MRIFTKEDLNNHDLSLTYDDISLVPKDISRIKSRKDANTESSFLDRQLSLPVLSSPMDSVTGVKMAESLHDLGCIGIINRFDSSLSEVDKNANHKITAVSISLGHDEENIDKFAERGYIICIDTANAIIE